jgi:hypothetical protein
LKVLAQNTGQAAATAGTTKTGGFSMQGLSINFTGFNDTLPQNGGGNGGAIQFCAFQIQVNEVKLTLDNAATGRTAQNTAPQPAGATAGAAAPLTKSASA